MCWFCTFGYDCCDVIAGVVNCYESYFEIIVDDYVIKNVKLFFFVDELIYVTFFSYYFK